MEFETIYSEPEVYNKLLASFRRQSEMANTSIVINKSFNASDDAATEDWWDAEYACDSLESACLAMADVHCALSSLVDSPDKDWLITDLEYALKDLHRALESAQNPEARKCITSMLKDVYLWLYRYNESEALRLNAESQKHIGEAEKYLEKANQLHL